MVEPTRYFVEYEDTARYEAEKAAKGEAGVDPANFICEEAFDDLDRARAFMVAKQRTTYAAIYERNESDEWVIED